MHPQQIHYGYVWPKVVAPCCAPKCRVNDLEWSNLWSCWVLIFKRCLWIACHIRIIVWVPQTYVMQCYAYGCRLYQHYVLMFIAKAIPWFPCSLYTVYSLLVTFASFLNKSQIDVPTPPLEFISTHTWWSSTLACDNPWTGDLWRLWSHGYHPFSDVKIAVSFFKCFRVCEVIESKPISTWRKHLCSLESTFLLVRIPSYFIFSWFSLAWAMMKDQIDQMTQDTLW